ncbi:MAG: NUDIX hydrolase [Actinomycetota bacterium]|nr:NUDIX hydrolase [Actinomycetota bacterium]
MPGGARASDESAVAAALRETAEETGLPVERVALLGEVVDDHGGWSYTTVRGALPAAVPVQPLDGESVALAWVPLDEVHLRPLHPGFAAAWPAHLAALRAGAAAR